MSSQQSSGRHETIIHRGQATIRRLADFGLTPEPLIRAARAAEMGRDACVAHHPPTYPGSRAWADGNAALADALVPSGFVRRIETNVPLLYHPATGLLLTMVAGDRHTGTDARPSTKNDRGPAASRMIDSGLDLFIGTEFAPQLPSLEPCDLWLFLWYRSGEVIRCELSLPVAVVGGEVVDWRERTILDRFALKDEMPPDEASFPAGPDFDVPVTRKES